ncbi:peroxiredoxin [Ruficoccus sp. ZRK36]|uniref:peroxiredoxin n=1 Tax=Ruficoccus sp. ZRK36 TaxID=2866311 RepID=UPI001C7329BE|nr:peroxiredoxin [Ruficoccus sp. ZRK36]QYY36638.1 peroxiredoxin [Ruficoccus sp. ZRK36]
MKNPLLILAGALGLSSAVQAEPLKVGDDAPVMVVVNQDGEEVDLGNVYAEGTTLVYFYPKADTPGCTAQACSLRDAYTELTDAGVTVIGVSGDSVKSQKAFAEKYKLPFTLVSDPDSKLMEAFGVPHRLSFASRQAYLIRDGKIVWLDYKASTKQQAADALAALKDVSDGS